MTEFYINLVVDEIRLQKNHLEMLRQAEPGFNAAGYMICTNDGQQRKKRFIEKPYARMLSRCRLPLRIPHHKIPISFLSTGTF